MSKVVKGINKAEEVNVIDYNTASLSVLRDVANKKGIKGTVNMNQDKIVELLNEIKQVEEMKAMENKVKAILVSGDKTARIELNKLTVTTIKSIIKGAGMKGLSNKNKANLIEAVIKNKAKFIGEAEVKSNTELVANIKTNKESIKKIEEVEVMNNNNIKELVKEASLNRGSKKLARRLARLAAKENIRRNRSLNIIKKDAKDIKIVYTPALEVGVETIINNGKRYIATSYNTCIRPSQESSLLRAAKVQEGKLADSIMVNNGAMTLDILSITYTETIKDKNKRSRELFELALNRMISGINVVYNSNTGLLKMYKEGVKIAKEEKIITYKFMGVTPAGLRSASILCGATHVTNYEGITVCVDKRTDMLNDASEGAFACNFTTEDNKFKTVSKLDKLFKDAIRITQCAPGSKDIMLMENYIVATNIAAEAKDIEGNEADKVTDGNSFISLESIMEKYYIANNVPVNANDVEGMCGQYRGASLKASCTIKTRDNVNFISKKLISEGHIEFIVYNGVRYSLDQFNNLSQNEKEDFFSKNQMLGDMNVFKLRDFNEVWMLTKLKEAYTSVSNTNMVVNMAMLQFAPAESYELLLRRGKKELSETFKDFGTSFELSEDMKDIIPQEFSLEGKGSLNNESQLTDYLYKNDPARISAMLPGVVKSKLNAVVKSLRSKVNSLNLNIDSKYTVVQSDPGAILGAAILNENEVFCQDYNVPEVSAVRHPISSTLAVTTFKVVNTEEMLERVQALNISSEAKAYIMDSFLTAKGYVIIPASHYLMEKHDGMDFDIDAMQIILDQEIVAILKKIPNIGSNISSKYDWMRKTILNAEQNIKEGNFIRPETEIEKPEADSNSKETVTAKGFTASIKKIMGYSYSYASIGRNVVKDFFMQDVANVGEIATAFYNNVCILIALRSSEISNEEKVAIVAEFKRYYKCTSKAKYKAVVIMEQKGDKKIYDTNKLDCCEAIHRFADSTGTQEELEAFLEDCIYFNRFLAETSIDAAKNRFFVNNMFNHAKIVKAAGSDKNMGIITEAGDEANKIYKAAFNKLGLDTVAGLNAENFFNVEMLSAEKKGIELSNLEAARREAAKEAAMKGTKAKKIALSIMDPLGKIRIELMNFANELIVLATKQLEVYVNSDASKEIRSSIIAEAKELNNYDEILSFVYGVRNAYAAITTSAKETDEFDGRATVEYLKNQAIKGCRNMATLGLSNVDEYSIGLVAVSIMTSEDGTKNVNPALFKVLEKEIVAYLNAIGVDNMGLIGESVAYAKLDGELVDLSEVEDTAVEVINGKAVLKNGTIICTNNKKANIEGTITTINDSTVIVGSRKYNEDDLSAGAYFNIDTRYTEIVNESNAKTVKDFEAVQYQIVPRYTSVNGKVYYNVVCGINENGKYKVEGCISATKELIGILSDMTLTPDNFSVFTSEKGMRVFFLCGEECENMLYVKTTLINSDVDFSSPEVPVVEEATLAIPEFESCPIMNSEILSEDQYSYDFYNGDCDFEGFAAPVDFE